jgi:hypothetical protein
VELRLAQPADVPAPVVTVNQIRCQFRAGKPDGGGVMLMTYDVPETALPGNQRDSVEVVAPGDVSVKTLGVEVCIAPGR